MEFQHHVLHIQTLITRDMPESLRKSWRHDSWLMTHDHQYGAPIYHRYSQHMTTDHQQQATSNKSKFTPPCFGHSGKMLDSEKDPTDHLMSSYLIFHKKFMEWNVSDCLKSSYLLGVIFFTKCSWNETTRAHIQLETVPGTYNQLEAVPGTFVRMMKDRWNRKSFTNEKYTKNRLTYRHSYGYRIQIPFVKRYVQ
jgi:hypothetical protein